MKKIFKYSIIVSFCAALVSLAGCQKKEVDVNPLGGDFAFSGMAPNPVMRGGALRIYGRNLDQVSAVNFAGDIEVTEFVKLSKGAKLDTLEVIVPLEGPEVGKVVLNVKDGRKFTSFSDLSYSEPIEVESIAPKAVLSGDVLTIKGEYLNDVKEVIFTGEDAYAVDFESQSRHELKVVVPANAITGPVILSDVNEVTDANSIPNHIYTEDLTVGDPTVAEAAKATYKSGDVITVSGAHLDMIQNVAVPQVSEVSFAVSTDGTTITFTLPAEAGDGNIVLTSFAGKDFNAGEIESVTVKDLVVVSKADDQRFKAGCDVEISGSDLDLVTKVEFTGAEAEWSLKDGKIVTKLPAKALDGVVTVSLASGKKATSEAIEVVKPVLLGWSDLEAYVAGETIVTIEGDDLDLVESVKMGYKKQGFFDCEFEAVTDDIEEVRLKVTIPAQAYSAPIIIASAAGYEDETAEIEVSYKMAVSIVFDEAEFAMGKSLSLTGTNLLKVEQVYIKGQKVTDYAVRADDAMSFTLPEKVGPGVYRLDLVLTDGTEMTWPVPFDVTAPFTETFVWTGSAEVDGWAGVTLGDDRFIWNSLGLKEGDVIKLYYTAPEEGWWDLQLCNGHWGGLELAELDGGNEIKQDAGFPGGSQSFSFNVTEAVVASLTEDVGWGGAMVINGDGKVVITGLSLIQFGSAKKYLWQGDIGPTNWDGDVKPTGVVDLDTLEPGMTMGFEFYVEDGEEVGQVEFMGSWWDQLPSLMYPDGTRHIYDFQPGETSIEFVLTAADINIIKTEGFLFVGNGGLHITGIYVL
jgi:hypothetical protein